MSTTLAKKETVVRKWYVLDAAGVPLGRTAVIAANILRGKHKPDWTPNVDCGDFVIVINSAKAVLTGKKLDQKFYRRHSGWVGGLKETKYKYIMEKRPEFAMTQAIKGMMSKNTRDRMALKRLRVFKGADHVHEAQKPIVWRGIETMAPVIAEKASPPEKKAPAEKKPAAEKKAPAEKKPAAAEKKAPMEKKTAAAEKKAPAEKKPAAEKKAPAEKKTAAAEKKAPAEKKPAAAEKKAPAEKKTAAAEKKAPVEKKTAAAEKKEPAEKKPAATEKKTAEKAPAAKKKAPAAKAEPQTEN